MANIAFQRLQREFKEVVTSKEVAETGIKLETVDDQFTTLQGEIRGPPDSSYEGGVFTLSIDIPQSYPFKPPEVKFRTRIWHPNISSQTGTICLDVLKDQWAASMTLRTVLLSIQSLLSVPEPNDPQDAVVIAQTCWTLEVTDTLEMPANDVARQCLTDAGMFRRTARFWAQFYASAPDKRDPDMDRKLTQLTDMGVPLETALDSLSSVSWDLAQATERIFS